MTRGTWPKNTSSSARSPAPTGASSSPAPSHSPPLVEPRSFEPAAKSDPHLLNNFVHLLTLGVSHAPAEVDKGNVRIGRQGEAHANHVDRTNSWPVVWHPRRCVRAGILPNLGEGIARSSMEQPGHRARCPAADVVAQASVHRRGVDCPGIA